MHCKELTETTVTDNQPILLIGNPNVGKSAIFSQFTGRQADISNYPGTTVELTKGLIQLDNTPLPLIDTPGIHSLLPHSDDERATRDILLEQCPWAVIQVADAKNLRRALLLTIQLAEYEIPFVLALNMDDEARATGIRIDHKQLAQILGADVVPTVAVRGQGIEALRATLAAPRPVSYQIRYDGAIEAAVSELTALFPEQWNGKRAIALALLVGDEIPAAKARQSAPVPEAEWQALQPEIEAIVARTAAVYDQQLGYAITRQRLRCVDCLLAQVWQAAPEGPPTFTEKADRFLIHPVWGWFFLAFVLFVMYLFVGRFGAGTLVDWIENTLFGQWINPAATKAVELVPIPLLQEFLIGEYGLITMALSYSLAIVLPIVLTFFLAFSFLEDSGYLARLAIMANRPFKLMGLNGKAVLPMVLGLGCDTMATLTTRILETRKERLQVTLLLALGVPCSAQLGVLLGMVAILTRGAVIIWLGTIILVLFAVGWLASRILPGQSSDFILELPPIRKPALGNILIKTLARVEWYLKEVLPLFILGTVLLFLLDKFGLLAILEQLLTPLIEGVLGLPGETAGVFLIGFLRRDFGAAGLFTYARSGLLTHNQLVISLVVITLFIPCIANVLMIIREHGKRTALAVTAFVFPFAFLVGGLLNLLFRWFNIQF